MCVTFSSMSKAIRTRTEEGSAGLEAATDATTGVDDLSTGGGLHAGAESGLAEFLYSAQTTWVMHFQTPA